MGNRQRESSRVKRPLARLKAVRPEEGLRHVDPETWRAPPGGRDWVEYAVIAAALVAAAFFFG